MKRFSKALVTLLVVITILGTLSVGFAAPADVAGTDYEKAVTRLSALGIMGGFPDGTFKPGDPLTRAQAARIVVSALGLDKAAELAKGATQFTDVPADHWASGYINVAVSQGIIVGMGDGTFQPEANVTYAQILKMMLMALNYGPALKKAQWPAGYLSMADQIGLSDDVNVAANVAAVRGDVAVIVDNALDIPMLKQQGYGDLETYEPGDDDYTLFIKKHKATEYEGRVTAFNADDNEITLTDSDGNETTLALADALKAESYFGLEVTAWEKNDEVFFVEIDTPAEDIITGVVAYDDTDDEWDINGKSYDSADDLWLSLNDSGQDADGNDLDEADFVAVDHFFLYGRVILDDGKVTFVDVDNYEERGIVDRVELNRSRIVLDPALHGTTAISLSENTFEDGYTITKDGAEIELADVEAGDLVYVATIGDEAKVMVVSKTVTGEFTRRKGTDMYIDGTKYSALYGAEGDADVGDDITATLNIEGDIVYVDVNETDDDSFYGIIASTPWEDEDNELWKVRVYTKDGKVLVKSEDDLVTDLNSAVVNQTLVEVTVDSDGIATVVPVTPDKHVANNEVTDIDADRDRIETTNDGNIYVGEDTVIFALIDNDEPVVVDWADLEDLSNVGALALDVVGDSEADVIVITDGYGSAVSEDEYALVKDVYETKDGWVIELNTFTGEETLSVTDTVYNGGELTDAIAEEMTGEFVKFTRNADGDVSSLAWTVGATPDMGDVFTDENGVVLGEDPVDNDKYLTVGSHEYVITADTVIYVMTYDADDEFDGYVEGGVGDLVEGDTVYVVANSDDEAIIIVVRPNFN